MSRVSRWGDPPPVVHCRHGGGAGVGAVVGGLLAFGWWYGKTHPATKPHPAKPPAPVIKTITRTVVVHTHPALSGTDIVLIVLCVCIAVVAVASLARHWRG